MICISKPSRRVGFINLNVELDYAEYKRVYLYIQTLSKILK